MKVVFSSLILLLLITAAYFNAQLKLQKSDAYLSLKIGMSAQALEEILGSPSSQVRNQLTYILSDSSILTVTLRDDVISSAKIQFHAPIKIEDPEFKRLTFVQMEVEDLNRTAGWFYAGKPEEGLVYKITSDGYVESLTWVPPFTYGTRDPKNLQALLRDFKTQQTIN